MVNKKTLMQITKTMNKIDKGLEVVNNLFTELQGLYGDLEEELEEKKDSKG